MLLLIIELVQRTPELANNFIFIRCRSHPFNLIHTLYGDSRAHVSRILIASPAMQITRVNVAAVVGAVRGNRAAKKRAILHRHPFPFLAHSRTRLAQPLALSRRDPHAINAINIPRDANSVAEQQGPSLCSLSTPRATTMFPQLHACTIESECGEYKGLPPREAST